MTEFSGGTAAVRQPKRSPVTGKVLFLIDNLLEMGGAEGALSKIVGRLPALGFPCSIATFHLRRDPEYLPSFPCPVREFPLSRTISMQGIRTAFDLRKFVRQERFDIIHTMFPTSDLWGGPVAQFGSDTLLVSGRRDLGIVRTSKHDLMYRWLGRHLDQVQAVSDAASQACIERDKIQPGRVFTVHNGVEIEKIAAQPAIDNLAATYGLHPDGKTVIASVGQIWPVKGVDTLVDAAAIVCRKHPKTNFIIAGFANGEWAEQLQWRILSLGLESNVKIVGYVRSIIPLLKASDIFCLLSRSEGLSNALLEAMACGLPPVVSNVGGNPEVVCDQQSGFLVPRENPEAAAERIIRLIEDPALARRMGENGRARVNQYFTADAMVRRMAELYSGLLAGRNARGKSRRLSVQPAAAGIAQNSGSFAAGGDLAAASGRVGQEEQGT